MNQVTTPLGQIDYDMILSGQIDRVHLNFDRLAEALWYKSPEFILKEARTVGITTPRQSGKSEWALKQVRDDLDTVMIVPTRSLRDMSRHPLPENDHHRIMTSDEQLSLFQQMKQSGKIPDFHPKRIIVDEYRYCYPKATDRRLYKWLGMYPNWKDMIVITLN